MGLSDYKITDAAVTGKGVVAAPDQLTGTAQENKMVFDRLIREVVKDEHNSLVEALIALGAEQLVQYGSTDIRHIRLNTDGHIEVSADGEAWTEVSSSGHIIYDKDGAQMPQRSRMRFEGETQVRDDGTYTVVSGLKGEAGESAYTAASSGGYAGTETQFNDDLANVGNAVRFITQTLTDTQQAQARTNIGLGNVDNTSDADKPVSTAQQAALELKANTADVNAALDGKVSHNAAQSLTVAQKEQAQSNIGVTWPCNPNLLDNWYFGNPVNQRGQTEYTRNWDLTIDRWKTGTSTVTVDTENGCVRVSADGNYPKLMQYIEKERVQFPVILSVLMHDGTLATNVFRAAGYGAFLQLPSVNDDSALAAGINVATGVAMSIRAMKLELGTQQTLAHQDADGNWVLNEIPNYAEQLARCQRSFVRYGDASAITPLGMCNPISSTTGSVHVPLPAPMRATPTATLTGSITTRRSGDSTTTHSSASVAGASPSEAMLTVSGGSMSTQYYPYDAYLAAGSYLDLSADL